MDWKTLLNNSRLDLDAYKTPSTAHVREIHSSQSDVDRVLYSSAFRRLKGKTQVFMFPPTDYHRDRLTHSLEVYNISRILTSTIIRRISTAPEGAAYALIEAMDSIGIDLLDVVDSISAAALAHDIGNTPFGHIGEHALRSWFANAFKTRPNLLDNMKPQQQADFLKFDGNAQAFRVVAKLQGWSEGGLRLSYMTLGALMKYPLNSLATTKGKFGYFSSEEEAFLKTCNELGLKKLEDKDGKVIYARHPFAYIVEAADDIAYRTTDVEDGIKARLIPYDEGYDLLFRFGAKSDTITTNLDYIRKKQEKIKYLRAGSINSLVDACANAFIKNIEDIVSGTMRKSLLECSSAHEFEFESKTLLEKHVYYEAEKMRNEAGAHTIVSGLLDSFADLVEDYHRAGNEFDGLSERNKNVVHILGKGTRDLGVNSAYNLYQLVVDFISGMTDRYATNLYRNLEGNSLTMR